MFKNKTANCRVIQNIETKVTTELKRVRKGSSELLEAQQTYHDAVLTVCTYPSSHFALDPKYVQTSIIKSFCRFSGKLLQPL